LQQCRQDLRRPSNWSLSQEQELATLGENARRTERRYKEKEAALTRQKASLEEKMVAVVVQQIREAQKAEREAVREECNRDIKQL